MTKEQNNWKERFKNKFTCPNKEIRAMTLNGEELLWRKMDDAIEFIEKVETEAYKRGLIKARDIFCQYSEELKGVGLDAVLEIDQEINK